MADDDDDPMSIGWTASQQTISFYYVVCLSLIALVLVLSKLLHDRPILSTLLPEAGMIIIVGIIAGGVVYYVAPDPEPANDDDGNMEAEQVVKALVSFSPTAFFLVLLPPIIFSSGYHLKRELFIRHINPILRFACIGTVVATLSTALILQLAVSANLTGGFEPTFAELLTFGALISSTDPVATLAVFQQKRVDPHLFYLVFGESVLNDAIGLVLFDAFGKFVGHSESITSAVMAFFQFIVDFSFICIGSFVFGSLSGIFLGVLLKVVDMRNTPMLELGLYIGVMYLPFFTAEVLELSGIVTILFTGIMAKRFAEPNLSPGTKVDADVLFRLTAYLAEAVIFLELGLSVFGLSSIGNFHVAFIAWSMLACLISRAINVYPIVYFFNRSLRAQSDMEQAPEIQHTQSNSSLVTLPDNRDLKIAPNTANMVWFSGLRGAVAYACAKSFPNDLGNAEAFVITTMVIVLITVFIMGGTTSIVLDMLNIEVNVDEELYMLGQEEQMKNSKVHGLDKFANKYVFPYVVRDFKDEIETQDTNLDDRRAHFETNDSSRLSNIGVEMTEMDYMRQNGISRGKSSLYDYGF